jgi:hypothetical protein
MPCLTDAMPIKVYAILKSQKVGIFYGTFVEHLTAIFQKNQIIAANTKTFHFRNA